jgi:hypothetical protein
MPDRRPDVPDPSAPDRNPLGLGARDPEESNTGSVADTSYDAQGSDPYTTGEPRETFGAPSESEPARDRQTDADEP